MHQPALPRCGEPADPLAATGGPLLVTASFPAVAERSGGAFTGTVTVEAGAHPVSGVVSPEADVYVTRGGTVVATPLVKDLLGVPLDILPGATQTLGATGSLRACAAAGHPSPDDALPPGAYDVYAVVAVTDDAGGTTVSTGGPWSLTVV
ncbi:MAG TPA: hypothetical protein VHM89_09390 [Acidimicrobiales bacterium]|nr:hypothetical protein [Acidimicrobiales bacterium]